ncbi:peptidoglycan DD-metalloendopeptidase family protein [Argonema galeatum]|uniref:peptidoglycan DD-metalloendopeptidase family protein n=1 Tax=Argonema galeatum TaxID=2942762 RepID=UPI002012C63A|nr:peptidoglycan DD-metalloendopeptidase family protein [Argonema galeatum]MCL1464746.1 peptidoglycan DD-metalloendopeptidase family protein [Argonema galeatum A003/A1]
MKRALTQKINPAIPACEVDNSAMVGQLKPIPPEVNRRARTSAAMIGLAISMGASSLLIPQQSESAIAAEPTASSALSTVPSTTAEVTPAGSQEVKEIAAASATTPEAIPAAEAAEVAMPKPLVLEHKAQEWQPTGIATSAAKEYTATQNITLNPSQKAYEVEPGNVTRKISGIGHDFKTRETVATESESYSVGQNQLGQSATTEASTTLPVSESATAAGNVNNLLKAKEAVALNRLRESSNRLRASLAEWKSEELGNTSAQLAEPSAPVAVPFQLKPVIEQAPASVGVSNWQPKVAAVEPAVATAPQADSGRVSGAEAWSPTVVPQPAVSAPTMVYQVKPGDTVDAIARNYGITVTALAKANELNNPNRIQIAQIISIPQSQSVGVTSSQPALDSSASEPVSPNFAALNRSSASSKPNVPIVTALAPGSSRDGISVPTVPSANWTPSMATASASSLGTDAVPPGFKGAKYEVPENLSRTKQSSGAGNGNDFQLPTPPGEPSLFAENEPNQGPQANSKQENNLYVERLRTEILQLREQYRHQQGSDVLQRLTSMRQPYAAPNATPTVTPPALTPPPAVTPLNSSPESRPSLTSSTPVNRDYNPNRYNEALQAEIQRRSARGPSQQSSIQIPVAERGTDPAKRQQQLVATAPIGPEAYQPYNQPAPRMVAPELPALPGPDNYLPGGLNQNLNGYNWPTRGVLTSGFGRRWGRMHKGIDIAAPTGTPIVASAPGVVVYARWNSGGYGNLVDIRHADGSLTRYGHNSRIFVQEGQAVEQGQQIAAMGSTGHSTGPHCHFEVHPPGQGAVNPIAFLPSR